MSATNALEIGSDLWNARVYSGLSVASELAARLDKSRLVASSLLSSWAVYRKLGKLNRDLDEIFKEYDRPVPFPVELPGKMIQDGRDILLKLYADCKRLESPSNDLPLHALISKRLARLQIQSERILDIADWFDAMITPEETNAKFESALSDLARGDVVPLASV